MTAQPTAEEIDTERALQLREHETGQSSAAFTRLRLAVQSGNIDAMRAAFDGINGFLIGLWSSRGQSESVVFEEILKNCDLSLDLLGVFFRELGGRFIVDSECNVCVFSLLVLLDNSRYAGEEGDVKRWESRMAEVVRYLVEELNMPIRMWQHYRIRPGGRSNTLLGLARDASSWACYAAIAPYYGPLTTRDFLWAVLTEHEPDVCTNYWVQKLAVKMEDEHILSEFSRNPTYHITHREILWTVGVEREMSRYGLMQALLLMQKDVSTNTAAKEVMDHKDLSYTILMQGFDQMLFLGNRM
jgi:hypothetical protein